MAKKNKIVVDESMASDSKKKNNKEVVKNKFKSSVKDTQKDSDGKTYNISINTKDKDKNKSKPGKKNKSKSKFKEVVKIRDEQGKLLIKETTKKTSRNGKTRMNRNKVKYTKNYRNANNGE